MSDDSTDRYAAGDLLLGVLALMAPEPAVEVALRMISQYTSKTASKEAAKIIEHFKNTHTSASEFLKDACGALEPELEGPKEEPSEVEEDLLRVVSTLLQSELMEVLMQEPDDGHDLDEPTPGCDCPRCTNLRRIAQSGLDVRVVEFKPQRSKKDVN